MKVEDRAQTDAPPRVRRDDRTSPEPQRASDRILKSEQCSETDDIDADTPAWYAVASEHFGERLNDAAEQIMDVWIQQLPIEDQIDLELLREETKRIDPRRRQCYRFRVDRYATLPESPLTLANVLVGDGRTKHTSEKIAIILRAKLRDPKHNLSELARQISYREDSARKVWQKFKPAVESLRTEMHAVGFDRLPEEGDEANLRELLARILERRGETQEPLQIGCTWTPRRRGCE